MTTPFAFLAETHSAVVVGLGDRVLKLRKPVDLGFLDQRTVAQRRAACEHEIQLNRRFSPDVYLGLGAIEPPEPGQPAEPLVVMRRLPDDRRLTTLLEHGHDVTDEIRRIAHVVAGYHAIAPQTPAAAEAASEEATRRRWETNASEMQRWVGTILDEPVYERVGARATRYLAGRGPLLRARIDEGWARDGHGDLMADDIFCLDDGPRILDCLDFDEALRVGDVLADVAFLAMDLERLGHSELGWSFLRTHAELLGDTWPASLAHLHVAYRAQVRAKVACIRADQGDEHAATSAQALLALADRHLADTTVRLVLVGGAPGTGKSTLAAAIGERFGIPVLRADEVRKELAGLDADTDARASLDQGIYTEAHTRATYRVLVERARALLGGGVSVVLDAGWRDAALREEATQMATEVQAMIVPIECRVPEDLALERIARRRASGGDPSDVDASVARRLRARAASWPEAQTIDTSTAPDRSADEAVAMVRRVG